MKFLSLALKTLRLAIVRIGPGWMFGLLTINFNYVTAHMLGAVAFIIMTLVGLHHFLAPLQVWWGHLADRYPIAGYRRTPYIFLSGLASALVFLCLPWIAIQLGNRANIMVWDVAVSLGNSAYSALSSGSPPDYHLTPTTLALANQPLLVLALALVLFAIFGIAMAANGNSSAALVAEVIEDEKHRGTVFVVVWLFMIFSSIAAAAVTKSIMPHYNPAHMQALYNLTLPIVLITSLVGLIGMERRISPEEHAALMAQPSVETSSESAFQVFRKLVLVNPHVRRFFLFVLLAIFGIFLQDGILEVFGGDVFHMSQEKTATFTQVWGGGMLSGIVLVVILTRIKPTSRKSLATIGGLGIALGLGIIVLASVSVNVALVTPGLFLMGICTGLFNIGALSLMIDMTVEGHTGLYMGMWGLAQGFGNGLANSLSGGLRTILIESGLFRPAEGYGLIFGFGALVMILSIVMLQGISVQEFKGLQSSEVSTVIALDTAA